MPTELRRLPEPLRAALEEIRDASATIAEDYASQADSFLAEALVMLRRGHIQEAMDLVRDARAEVLAAKADARLVVSAVDRVRKGRG